MKKLMSLVVAALIVSSFSQVHAKNLWDLNDVSYLLPLPQKVAGNQLLSLDTLGSKGPVIGTEILTEIPRLTLGLTREEGLSASRVIGVRIDPCFSKLTPQKCQPQVRLVWQPLAEGRRGQLQAEDATMHSFHDLSGEEFKNLLKDLKAWRDRHSANTGYTPLYIHPAWNGKDDRAESVQDFQKILLKYVGQENLSRVTAMVLRANGMMWVFAGFEVVDKKLEMFEIPRLGGRLNQSFVNMALDTDEFQGGGIAPVPKGEDTLNNLAANSNRLDESSNDIVISEARAAYRIENPKNYTSENMDCVSCHVTQASLQWVAKKRGHLGVEKVWNSEIYKNNKFNLENLSKKTWHSQNVRIFGYFGTTPAVSQRVINESAEVAESLSSQYK